MKLARGQKMAAPAKLRNEPKLKIAFAWQAALFDFDPGHVL